MFYSCYLTPSAKFSTTGHTEDRPCSGRPRVMMHHQDGYIQNTYRRSCFQTDTATAANNHGTHNNRISVKTACNHLHEGVLSACRPYVDCVLSPRKSCSLGMYTPSLA